MSNAPHMLGRTEDDQAFSMMCIDACRYVLGRMTYAPGNFQHLARENINRISSYALLQMKRDVEKAVEEKTTGDLRIDHPGWVSFLEFLIETINKRDKGIKE